MTEVTGAYIDADNNNIAEVVFVYNRKKLVIL